MIMKLPFTKEAADIWRAREQLIPLIKFSFEQSWKRLNHLLSEAVIVISRYIIRQSSWHSQITHYLNNRH